MRRLHHVTSSDALAIAAAATSLPTPPTNGGVCPDRWSTGKLGSIPEVDLDVRGSTTISMTVAKLLGAKSDALVVADIAITSVANATDTFTKNAHGLLHGDGPVRFSSTLTLPAGIEADVDYWIVLTGANTFKVATSLANALSGTVVNLTDDGTGVITLSDTPDTARLTWSAISTLPTPIALTNQIGYTQRFSHRPGTVAYALVGTLDTGAVSANMIPVFDRD